MNVAYKNILKATTLFGSVQGLNILINLVRTKLVAVILGPAGVGLNSIYNETKEMIHETTNCGMDQSGVRDISKAYEHLLSATNNEDKIKWAGELTHQVTILRSWEILLATLGLFVTILLAEPLSQLTFQDKDHTWGYILLSPAVALSTINCGEMVVLKALRRLKAVATLSTANVVLGLVVTIPIYYWFGLTGVIPAIIALCAASAAITVCCSYRYSTPVINWHWQELRKGIPMLKLGACFVLTGLMGHGMELIINSYINVNASEVTVGLYRAGYTITGTYAALLFNAISADFFPRLSGIVDDVEKRNTTVCQQMEVLLVLVGPMTVALLVALPALIPLLFSSAFNAVIPMTRIAIFGVLFSAIYIPAAYLPLAAGDSKMFLFIETVSTLTMGLIIVGFGHYGLIGAGIGKTMSTIGDTIVVLSIAMYYYKIRMSRSHLLLMLCHTALLVLTYYVTSYFSGWIYWVTGIIMMGLSSTVSLTFLKVKA